MTSSGPLKGVRLIGTPQASFVPPVNWRELLCWWLKRRVRYRVTGRSMQPVLEDNDEVLVSPSARIREGDIVVARHPFKKDVIWVKRLMRFDESGNAFLQGIHQTSSTDSRTQGSVPKEHIYGRVMSRL